MRVYTNFRFFLWCALCDVRRPNVTVCRRSLSLSLFFLCSLARARMCVLCMYMYISCIYVYYVHQKLHTTLHGWRLVESIIYYVPKWRRRRRQRQLYFTIAPKTKNKTKKNLNFRLFETCLYWLRWYRVFSSKFDDMSICQPFTITLPSIGNIILMSLFAQMLFGMIFEWNAIFLFSFLLQTTSVRVSVWLCCVRKKKVFNGVNWLVRLCVL